jgi:hypothetical protein
MPDYTPVYIQGRSLTLTTSASCVGGDLLAVTGSGTVAPVVPGATPSAKVVGVAAEDTPSGGRVTVFGFGPVHESIADGTVTAGDQITTASTASRQVKTLPVSNLDLGAAFNQAADNTAVNLAVNNARSVLGVALTTAADNTKVRWMQVAC